MQAQVHASVNSVQVTMKTISKVACLVLAVAVATAAAKQYAPRMPEPASCKHDYECDHDNSFCTPDWCNTSTGKCVAEKSCSKQGSCVKDDYCKCNWGLTGDWCEQDVRTCQLFTLSQPNWWLLMPDAAPNGGAGDKCLTCETGDKIMMKNGDDITHGCNGDRAEYWNGSKWVELPNHMFYATQHNQIYMSTIQAHQEFWREELEGKYVRLFMTCNNDQADCVTFIVERSETYWGQFDGPKGKTCEVDWKVLSNDGKRFIATLDVTSDRDLDGWEVFFRWPEWEVVDRVWGANIEVWSNHTLKDDFVSLTNKEWNSKLTAGDERVSFIGLEGVYKGPVLEAPGEFFLNGQYCTRVLRHSAGVGPNDAVILGVTALELGVGIAGVACVSALLVVAVVKRSQTSPEAREKARNAARQDDSTVVDSWTQRRVQERARAASLSSRSSRNSKVA